MAERELFQIGEVAKMYHLSVGTCATTSRWAC